MDTRYLTQDIISHTNRSNVYGLAGERVSLVTDKIGVKIVENALGKRYSVKDEYLSLTPLSNNEQTSTVSNPVVKTEKAPSTKQSKKPLTQAEKLQSEYLKINYERYNHTG